MSFHNHYERYGFEAPEEVLTYDEAVEFVYAGLAEGKVPTRFRPPMFGKPDLEGADIKERDAAWLDFCARVFVAEDYAEDIMLECARAAYDTLPPHLLKRFGWLPKDELDFRPIEELCDEAYYAIEDGDLERAGMLTFRAAEKCIWFTEDWARVGIPVFSFDNPIEKEIYVAIFGDENPFEWRFPNLAYAFRMRGEVMMERERYAEALRFLLMATSYDPVSAPAFLSLAECSLRLGHMDKVKEQARVARENAWRLEDMSRAHYLLGYAYDTTRDIKRAEANLVIASDYLDGEDIRIELDYVRRQKPDDSEMSLEEALDLEGYESNGDCAVSRDVELALDALSKKLKEDRRDIYRPVLEEEKGKWHRADRISAAAAVE